MELVYKLEKTVGQLYKNAPHLPVAGQKWLATNVWWLAAIGAAMGALAVLWLVPLALAAMGLSVLFPFAYGGGYYTGFWFSTVLSLITLVAVTVLTGLAINPLKIKAKRGWNYLFLALVVQTAASVVVSVLAFDFMLVFNLFGAAVSAVIGAYFLFEIHGYFGVKAAKTGAKVKSHAAE